MDVHGGELFGPSFRVTLAGLFVAPLMITERFFFLFETTLSGGRGEICRLQPRVDRASDLLHRELPYLGRRRILLTDTGTEQVRELREVVVPMNTTPPSHFKVVHPQLVLGFPKTLFYWPASKGDPKQPIHGHPFLVACFRCSRRLSVCLWDFVRYEVLDLVGVQHIAGHNQAGRFAGQAFARLPIETSPFYFPHDRPLALT